MSALAIILIIVGALLLALFVGGYVASARRGRADADALHARLEEANRALALAHAQDKGWERSALEAAARAAFAARSSAPVRDLQLVQVVDRPGTVDDQAVFRVVTDGGAQELLLVRRGDSWTAG